MKARVFSTILAVAALATVALAAAAPIQHW